MHSLQGGSRSKIADQFHSHSHSYSRFYTNTNTNKIQIQIQIQIHAHAPNSLQGGSRSKIADQFHSASFPELFHGCALCFIHLQIQLHIQTETLTCIKTFLAHELHIRAYNFLVHCSQRCATGHGSMHFFSKGNVYLSFEL